jgi:hypothetical protein
VDDCECDDSEEEDGPAERAEPTRRRAWEITDTGRKPNARMRNRRKWEPPVRRQIKKRNDNSHDTPVIEKPV